MGKTGSRLMVSVLSMSMVLNAVAFSAAVLGDETCNIGVQRQLFVDTWLIDSMQNVELRLHVPEDKGPVIKCADVPWEGLYPCYTTVIYDEGTYRLYYRSNGGTTNGAYCYAESTNGIDWVRPVLRLHDFNGSRDNNIIIVGDGGHSFSPFLDKNPAAKPDEKYKAIGLRRTDDNKAWVLLAFVSADGIQWRLLQNEPVMTNGAFDSQNVAFWSEKDNCYAIYYRTKSGGHTGIREVSRATSTDFINWNEEGKVVQVDRANNPVTEEIYINQTSPYYRAPQISIATSARFVPGRCALLDGDDVGGAKYEAKYTDTSDAVLMTTRGGLTYNRTFMESWIRPGRNLKNWSTRSNYPGLGIVPLGEDEMCMFICRKYGMPDVTINRCVMRVDGFASAHADFEQGELLTKPFLFSGTALNINYATSAAGLIKVGILDENGKSIKGFSVDECLDIFGDRINETVRWDSGKSLAELAGQKVRLKFILKDADLYSFKFD